MPGRDDSSWRAGGAGRWLAVQQVVWAVAAVGVLAVAAPGQQTSDPAVARVLRELQAWEGDPVTVAGAQARAGDPAAARATLHRAIAHAKYARDLLAIEQVQAEMGDRDAALKTLLMARNSNLAGPQPRPDQGPSVNGRVAPPDPDLAARVANRQIPGTLTDIAIEQFRLGDRAAAEPSFEQALRSARTLEPHDRRWAIVLVIAARAKAGDFDAALKDVASIADRAERFEALSRINLRDRVVDTKILGRILRMIEADGVPPELAQGSILSNAWVTSIKIEPLIAMALAQAAANDRAEAGKTLQRARQTVEALGEEDTRYIWLGRIAWVLVKMGDAAEASRMAGAIGKTERNWKSHILTEIAYAHAEIGDPANRKAWDDALRAAETGTQRVRVLFKIAEAQVYAGDREAALRTLEQALVAERSMNREELECGPLLNRDFLEARISVLRAEAGDITGAIRLANTIKHIQVQGDALARISAVQAASGDIKGALETAGAIRPPDPTQGWITDLSDQWYALPKIITAQARAGDVAGALTTADRLGPSREARLDALISIAEGFHQRNEMGKRAQSPRGP
jgi:tetratricopeptide (TPR) repeat protein